MPGKSVQLVLPGLGHIPFLIVSLLYRNSLSPYMTAKKKKEDKEEIEMSDEQKIQVLIGQVEFLKGLVNERNEQLKQAIQTIEAQNKTIELLNQSLDAMNRTNELLRKE